VVASLTLFRLPHLLPVVLEAHVNESVRRELESEKEMQPPELFPLDRLGIENANVISATRSVKMTVSETDVEPRIPTGFRLGVLCERREEE
jgi:hypothetical protein